LNLAHFKTSEWVSTYSLFLSAFSTQNLIIFLASYINKLNLIFKKNTNGLWLGFPVK